MASRIERGRVNLPASVTQRLQNIARAANHPYQFVLERYVQERFLYRLSRGPHRDLFILKGGLLFTALTERFLRATRDIDVRAFAENDEAVMMKLIIESLDHEVPDDAVVFNTDAMATERILGGDDERGIRLTIPATVGRQRTRVQLDAGFADALVMPEVSMDYPVLLEDLPRPNVRAYSEEGLIAEKFEAIASLGLVNSRFKDFDDIVDLARRKDFVCSALWNAARTTFTQRQTPMGSLEPAIAAENATSERSVAYANSRKRLHAVGMMGFPQCLESCARLHQASFVTMRTAANGCGGTAYLRGSLKSERRLVS